MKDAELTLGQVSPDAAICHKVQSWMVLGSAVVGGSTKNWDTAPRAKTAQPTAR
jgi:hypothetical protein